MEKQLEVYVEERNSSLDQAEKINDKYNNLNE